MPRKTFAAVLLFFAVLALRLSGKAVAGPPEGVPDKMVWADPVGEEVRQCRKEKDQARRLRRLTRLAPTSDPRVAVALFDLIDEAPSPEPARNAASDLLERYYKPPPTAKPLPGGIGSPLDIEPFHGYANPDFTPNDDPFTRWTRAEKELRRRAAQLPQ